MSIHKSKVLLIAAGLLIGVSGCTDTFVAPKSTASEENVFEDPDSYMSFLAKVYAGLVTTGQQGPAGQPDILSIDEGFSQYLRGWWQLNTMPTEEAHIRWGDIGLPELNTMTWAASNGFVEALFARIYFQVGMANEFLRQTSDEKLNERGQQDIKPMIQGLRAEARFLRALSYWHAIDLWGDVPLVDEDFPIGSEPPDQAEREVVYDFIVQELLDVRDLLPAPGGAEYGRADQGALAMLLAKVYMNAEVYGRGAQYGPALQELARILNVYDLDDDYQELFLADNHTSPEIIFPVPSDGQNTRTWGGMTYLVHAAVGGSMDPGAYGIDGGWWGLRVRREFVNLFPGVDGPDKRAIFYTDGHTIDIFAGAGGEFQDGYAAPKYSNITSSGATGSNLTFPDNDFPMFRLGDAYLMYAECVLRGGGGSTATAVDYINALRQRAYGNTSGNITENDLTLQFILDERARELWWEGHRRTDLVRFNQFSANGIWAWKGNVADGQTVPSFLDLYPIPSNQLISNPKLTQNEGY